MGVTGEHRAYGPVGLTRPGDLRLRWGEPAATRGARVTLARPGPARRGPARPGAARRGPARRGAARERGVVRGHGAGEVGCGRRASKTPFAANVAFSARGNPA
ncbi:hypothetical protein Ate01nite_57820 [Actinoplanes teichomyceticus]|nr:hypothetical protein Ate01nite_57820 [Actinoplanes teichomyceticus]